MSNFHNYSYLKAYLGGTEIWAEMKDDERKAFTQITSKPVSLIYGIPQEDYKTLETIRDNIKIRVARKYQEMRDRQMYR